MNYSLYLTILSPLSGLEKLTLCGITLILSVLLLDLIRRNIKKNKSSRMLKCYLNVKNNKWDDIVDLLTNPNAIKPSDIQNRLQVDLSKFDPRYRDLLYYELKKVNHNRNINELNLQLFVNILYNKSRN